VIRIVVFFWCLYWSIDFSIVLILLVFTGNWLEICKEKCMISFVIISKLWRLRSFKDYFYFQFVLHFFHFHTNLIDMNGLTTLMQNLIQFILAVIRHSALVACWCRQVMAQAVTLRVTALFVLMHSGIVNWYRYQLLCDARTVLEPHRGTAAFFFFTHYRPFPLFLFICLSLLTVPFLFLGASIVCVNNLKRTADLVLWFPDMTSVCTHPRHRKDLKVVMAISAI